MADQERHPHAIRGGAGAMPGAARAGNRRAPSVVSAKRPRDFSSSTAPAAVEEPVGPPPGRPSFGLTRRSAQFPRRTKRSPG